MKRHFLIASILLFSFGSKAQNIQLHYDFGRSIYDKEMSGRPLLTSTVEMFKSDKWGSTFFFIDLDYTSKGIASGYGEIARELKFWEGPFSIHIEYNGGLSNLFSYNNMYLAGGTYTYDNKTFTRGVTFSAMYKYIQKHDSPNNFQLTTTWYIHFLQKKCTFSGFADWWRETGPYGDFIFLTEPQFWVNLNRFKHIDEKFNLSIGSEVELSHNFGGMDGFYVVPTFAVKWSFD